MADYATHHPTAVLVSGLVNWWLKLSELDATRLSGHGKAVGWVCVCMSVYMEITFE